MPPCGLSEGSWKFDIITPGRPLNAFKVMLLVSETLSKMFPRAVTRRAGVEISHVKASLCNKKVAKSVNLGNCKYVAK